MTKHYYVSYNHYGYTTSVGFTNTWDVLAFICKHDRDVFINTYSAKNRSIQAICKKDIPKYHQAAKPFSGQRRALMMSVSFDYLAYPVYQVVNCYANEGYDL